MREIVALNYTEVGHFDMSAVQNTDGICIYLDKNDPGSLLTTLMVSGGKLIHIQDYVSPTEFATIEMKQVITMYVKRRVVGLDPTYYTKDDPKLHGFISKLSYEGIKYVAENLKVFAEAFKHNKVSEVLNIPKPSRKHRS